MFTQLSAGLSKLNLHKFRHNFRHTLNPLFPLNDGVEDKGHILQHCHSYDAQKEVFSTVQIQRSVFNVRLSKILVCFVNSVSHQMSDI